MAERPVSVTIVAWIVIVSSAWAVVSVPLMSDNPMLEEVYAASPIGKTGQIAWSLLSSLLTLGFGVAILKGRDWGRVGYAAFSLLGLVIGAFFVPSTIFLVPGALFLLVELFFLFRPAANRFFGRSWFGA